MFNIENQEHYQMKKGEWQVQMSPFALKWIEIYLKDIEKRLKRKTRLMEFGSGMSTVWFAKNLPNTEICSVEGDKEWFEKTQKWLKEEKVKANMVCVKQDSNYRLSNVKINSEYIYPFKGDWDIIINDGAIRETIGTYTMYQAHELIRPEGVYLRHDYAKAICGDWIQTGYVNLGYEQFCIDNIEYNLITVPGNGKWGHKAEFGGIWRNRIS